MRCFELKWPMCATRIPARWFFSILIGCASTDVKTVQAGSVFSRQPPPAVEKHEDALNRVRISMYCDTMRRLATLCGEITTREPWTESAKIRLAANALIDHYLELQATWHAASKAEKSMMDAAAQACETSEAIRSAVNEWQLRFQAVFIARYDWIQAQIDLEEKAYALKIPMEDEAEVAKRAFDRAEIRECETACEEVSASNQSKTAAFKAARLVKRYYCSKSQSKDWLAFAAAHQSMLDAVDSDQKIISTVRHAETNFRRQLATAAQSTRHSQDEKMEESSTCTTRSMNAEILFTA